MVFITGQMNNSKRNLTKELGDVLWYISALASDLDISLNAVARKTIYKNLHPERNEIKIGGSGDNR